MMLIWRSHSFNFSSSSEIKGFIAFTTSSGDLKIRGVCGKRNFPGSSHSKGYTPLNERENKSLHSSTTRGLNS